jgi:hypothetical protein
LLPAPGFGHLVGDRCPLAVADDTLPTVARRRHAPPARPQGFVLGADPSHDRRCLAVCRARSPPGCSPPPGALSRRRGGAFTSPPLMAFRKSPSSRPLP